MSTIPPTDGSQGRSRVGPRAGPKSSRGRAAGAWAGGVLVYVIIYIGLFVGGWAGGLAGAAAAFVVSLPLMWLAAKLLVRAKRHAAPAAEVLLARDQRPPVAYLRSFVADQTASKGVTFSSWFTEEEQIARVMNKVGPLIAFGEPGESLPEIGAARLYAANDEWRQVLHRLTTNARIVILRLGTSPSLIWEFENVLRWVRPQQIVLLVPVNDSIYMDFRQRSRSLMPHELPPLPSRRRRRLFRGTLQAVITFDSAWTPTFVDLQTISIPLLHRSPAYPLVPVLTLAFGPLFRQLGLPWQPPERSTRMIITIICLVVLVLLLVVSYL
jgi:hypothetical protein